MNHIRQNIHKQLINMNVSQMNHEWFRNESQTHLTFTDFFKKNLFIKILYRQPLTSIWKIARGVDLFLGHRTFK